MKKLLVAGIAAAAFCGAPALAADMPTKAPGYAPVAVYDWSGIYGGLHIGWQGSHTNVQNPAFPPGFDFDRDSAAFGGHIGIQKQFGQIVLGIEGSWTTTGRRNSGSVTCFAPGPQLTPGGTGICSTRLKDIWTVGPRIGWAAGTWMPYLAGGYANTTSNFEGSSNAGTLNELAQARLNGWYIGGGIDWAVWQNWILGIEYRHYDFNSKTVNATTPGGVFLELAQFKAHSDAILARVSYKFNPWGGR